MLVRRDAAYYELERVPGISDEEWLFVLRLQANEDAAYDELVRTYNTPIFHVAYRMLGDSAEAADIVQDIFLKVFKNINGFKGEAALKTWIYKIAFSEILNRMRWWRRRHRYSTLSLDEPHTNGDGPSNGDGFHLRDAGPTPEEALHTKEQEAGIQLALSKLSGDHRSIVVLRDIEGFAYGEIADVLGVSIGTVKSRLARARADLKQSLMRYLSVQRV